MDMIQSFADVIDELGGVTAFSRETGMGIWAARMARKRNSLGARWFAKTARAAERLEKPAITEKLLAELAEAQHVSDAA
jgi:ribosomal protein S7